MRALRLATDLSGMTSIVKLSQGGDALYGLFDKVCIVGGGRMFYFGRAVDAREYFVNLGFLPLPRQTTFDFLVSGVWTSCPSVYTQADVLHSHRSR